ncbi:MAG TPA: hypothetical protein VFD32_11065 [Dehalococcoidia bacterium]|nr:hypothetical protein [Dehalococcoidia bacterium]
MSSEQDSERAEAFGGKLEEFAATLGPAEQRWLLSICSAACSMLDPDVVGGYGVGPFGPNSPAPNGISIQQLATLFAGNSER